MDSKIIQKIEAERARQDHLHPHFPDPKRLAILMEEVGEVATALQNADINNLEEELIQVVAVGVRWLEHIQKERVNRVPG